MNKKNIVINHELYLLDDSAEMRQPKLLWALLSGFIFWAGVLALILWWGVGAVQAQEAQSPAGSSDPLVMKIYPDGTKAVVRWSEVGKAVDNGEKFGGAPRIVAYDPAKDGIVPIGQTSQNATASTNAIPQGSGSVVIQDQPAKMDYTNADPAKFDEQLGPTEGFCFRTAVGPSFQQSLSGRDNTGGTYYNLTFKPGIRFDMEPAYNVTDWFRVGVESAFVFNRLQRFAADDSNIYPGSDILGSAGLFQVPVLANIRFQFPSEGPWKGYVGGGIGANWNVLQLSIAGVDPYTSYHWNFAYQVTAGFTYSISPGFDLDIGYKLLTSVNPSFQNSGEVGGAIDPGQFKNSYNHTVEVGLAWRF